MFAFMQLTPTSRTNSQGLEGKRCPKKTISLFPVTDVVALVILFKVEFTHRVELSCTLKDGDVFWLWLSWLAVYIAMSLKSLTWGQCFNFFFFCDPQIVLGLTIHK